MVSDQLLKYCINHSVNETNELANLRRETYLKTIRPGMISGELQGQFLQFLCSVSHAKVCLEIGTFTGYATLCLAMGMQEAGKIISIEIDEELSYFHDKYLSNHGLNSEINVIYGDANKIISTIEMDFDLVFIDARKSDYKTQYELVLTKTKPGAMIIADNVLWKSEVLSNKKSKMAENLDEFNKYVYSDPRVHNLILPLRDGLNLMIRK